MKQLFILLTAATLVFHSSPAYLSPHSCITATLNRLDETETKKLLMTKETAILNQYCAVQIVITNHNTEPITVRRSSYLKKYASAITPAAELNNQYRPEPLFLKILYALLPTALTPSFRRLQRLLTLYPVIITIDGKETKITTTDDFETYVNADTDLITIPAKATLKHTVIVKTQEMNDIKWPQPSVTLAIL